MRNLLAWWLLGSLTCACSPAAVQYLEGSHPGMPDEVSISRMGDSGVTICETWGPRKPDAGAP